MFIEEYKYDIYVQNKTKLLSQRFAFASNHSCLQYVRTRLRLKNHIKFELRVCLAYIHQSLSNFKVTPSPPATEHPVWCQGFSTHLVLYPGLFDQQSFWISSPRRSGKQRLEFKTSLFFLLHAARCKNGPPRALTLPLRRNCTSGEWELEGWKIWITNNCGVQCCALVGIKRETRSEQRKPGCDIMGPSPGVAGLEQRETFCYIQANFVFQMVLRVSFWLW